MKSILTALSTFTFALVAHADNKAPDFTLSFKPTDGMEITATPPAGHHFNIEAPISPKSYLIEKTEKTVRFKFSKQELKTNPKVTVGIYLCDNAKTFCEKHTVEAKLSVDGKSSAQQSAINSNLTESVTPSQTTSTHGFILNDAKQALTQAKQQGKPLIIDFFGIWCPPCNMLDEEVFSKPDFQKAASHFVRLKLDADSSPSWELKSKYRVSGYPTIVFANSQGEEISRIVGFRAKAELLKELNRVWKNRNTSIANLTTKADQGNNAAAQTLGQLALDREEWQTALKYLAPGEARTRAEIGSLEEKGEDTKLIQKLEEALHEFPNSAYTLERHSKLAEVYATQNKIDKRNEQLTALVQAAHVLASHPARLKGLDLSLGDLWETTADAEEKLNHRDAAREAWLNGAKEYRKQRSRLGSASGNERGYNLELAFCLWKAGQVDEADALYRKLQAAYPKEFTFYFGHARMQYELKKFSEAREAATKAFEYSYGDNRLRVAHLLAETYEATGQRAKSLEVVHEALSSANLPDDKSLRTHRYAKKLKDLETKLNQRT